MHRFFIREKTEQTAILCGDDVKHASRVLRLQTGDAVTLCDGKGMECEAAVAAIEKDRIVCNTGTWTPCKSEPRCRVTLFQGLPKTGKMETIIQKCVELGIDTVVPVLTERCVVQPKESFQSRIERWQRVAEEAAKQSRRGMIPQIGSLMKLRTLSLDGFDRVLVAYENEDRVSLKQALTGFTGTSLAMLIGPEGGFSEEEMELLSQKGVISVSLGPRILRTETAGMAMLAQILYEVET